MPRLFSAAAFAHGARAIAQRLAANPGSTPVRSYGILRDDVPHYTGAVMEFLLPTLLQLSVQFAPSADAPQTEEDGIYPELTPAECSDALGLLVDGLRDNTLLQELDVRYIANMSVEDVHVFHDALATTRITHLAVSGQMDAQCRSMAARMWPALQLLPVHHGEHGAGTLLEALLHAVNDAGVRDLCLRHCGCVSLAAVAAFLRGNTKLLELHIREHGALPWLVDLAAALCLNRSLQALVIGALHAEHIRAFDIVLRVNSSLRSVVIDEYIYEDAAELAATMNALAAALRCNSTLQKLHLKVRLSAPAYAVYPPDNAATNPAVVAAIAALRSMSRAPAAQPLAVTVDFCNNPASYDGAFGGQAYGDW
jgi:hypothetical protein